MTWYICMYIMSYIYVYNIYIWHDIYVCISYMNIYIYIYQYTNIYIYIYIYNGFLNAYKYFVSFMSFKSFIRPLQNRCAAARRIAAQYGTCRSFPVLFGGLRKSLELPNMYIYIYIFNCRFTCPYIHIYIYI